MYRSGRVEKFICTVTKGNLGYLVGADLTYPGEKGCFSSISLHAAYSIGQCHLNDILDNLFIIFYACQREPIQLRKVIIKKNVESRFFSCKQFVNYLNISGMVQLSVLSQQRFCAWLEVHNEEVNRFYSPFSNPFG